MKQEKGKQKGDFSQFQPYLSRGRRKKMINLKYISFKKRKACYKEIDAAR